MSIEFLPISQRFTVGTSRTVETKSIIASGLLFKSMSTFNDLEMAYAADVLVI